MDLERVIKHALDMSSKGVAQYRATIAFYDSLVAAGFTYANTGVEKAGANDVSRRDELMYVALRSITKEGDSTQRLSAAQALAASRKDTRKPHLVVHGRAIGSIKGQTTWYGNATSEIGKWRRELAAREGIDLSKGRGKSDTFVDTLRKAVDKLIAATNAEPALPFDKKEALSHLRAVLALVAAPAKPAPAPAPKGAKGSGRAVRPGRK